MNRNGSNGSNGWKWIEVWTWVAAALVAALGALALVWITAEGVAASFEWLGSATAPLVGRLVRAAEDRSAAVHRARQAYRVRVTRCVRVHTGGTLVWLADMERWQWEDSNGWRVLLTVEGALRSASKVSAAGQAGQQ